MADLTVVLIACSLYEVLFGADPAIFTQYIVVDARFERFSYAQAPMTLAGLTVLSSNAIGGCVVVITKSVAIGRYSILAYHCHVTIDHTSPTRQIPVPTPTPGTGTGTVQTPPTVGR